MLLFCIIYYNIIISFYKYIYYISRRVSLLGDNMKMLALDTFHIIILYLSLLRVMQCNYSDHGNIIPNTPL